jgi:hypothetical protein
MKTKLELSKNVTMNKSDEKRQGMQVRQVVTGHDAKGRAVFVRDEQVDGMPIPGRGELAFPWNADEPATYPNAGNNPGAPGIFPTVGGIRFIMSTYLPGSVATYSASKSAAWSLTNGDTGMNIRKTVPQKPVHN